jgi:hypothetical protein
MLGLVCFLRPNIIRSTTVHYSLLGNIGRVRIPADCLQLGNHERSTGISLIWHKRLAILSTHSLTEA